METAITHFAVQSEKSINHLKNHGKFCKNLERSLDALNPVFARRLAAQQLYKRDSRIADKMIVNWSVENVWKTSIAQAAILGGGDAATSKSR